MEVAHTLLLLVLLPLPWRLLQNCVYAEISNSTTSLVTTRNPIKGKLNFNSTGAYAETSNSTNTPTTIPTTTQSPINITFNLNPAVWEDRLGLLRGYSCIRNCLGFKPAQPRSSVFFAKPILVNCKAVVPRISKRCQKLAYGVTFEQHGLRLYAITLTPKLSWYGAVQWCRSRGLQLGSLDTEVKDRELAGFFEERKGIDTSFDYFVLPGVDEKRMPAVDYFGDIITEPTTTGPPLDYFGETLEPVTTQSTSTVWDYFMETTSTLAPTTSTTALPSSELRLWTSATNILQSDGRYYWAELTDEKFSQLGSNRVFGKGNNTCVYATNSSSSERIQLISGNCLAERAFFCDVPRSCYAEACYEVGQTTPPPLAEQTRARRVKQLANSSTSSTARTALIVATTTDKPCGNCRPYECKKNPKSFDKQGNLIVNRGSAAIVEVCGQQYYVNLVDQKTSSESQAACCGMGMILLSLESLEKLQCLARIFEGTRLLVWTSGESLMCRDAHIWCSTRTRIAPNAPWLPGEPSVDSRLQGRCTLVHISPHATGLYLNMCSIKQNFFCEVPANATFPPEALSEPASVKAIVQRGMQKLHRTPYGSSLAKISCADLACKPNSNETATVDDQGNVYIKPTFGTIINACGKKYVLSNDKSTGPKARDVCCPVGLITADFESPEEVFCVLDIFKEVVQKALNIYIYAIDQKLNRTFTFCNARRDVIHEDMWLTGEPNNFLGMEPCVVLSAAPSSFTGLSDMMCSMAHQVLCEHPKQQERGAVVPDILYLTTPPPETTQGEESTPLITDITTTSTPISIDTSTLTETSMPNSSTLIYNSSTPTYNLSTPIYNSSNLIYNSSIPTSKNTTFKSLGNNNAMLKNSTSTPIFNTTVLRNGTSNSNNSNSTSILKNNSSTAIPSGNFTIRNNSDGNSSSTEIVLIYRTCPTWECNKQANFFNNKSGELLTNSSTFKKKGFLAQLCGGTSFLSTEERSYEESYTSCCKLGMRLVAIESTDRFDCFFKLLKASDTHRDRRYALWTSGVRVNTSDTFWWCSNKTQTQFRTQTPWMEAEPLGGLGVAEETCAALYISPKANGLFAMRCNHKLAYLCEPVTKKGQKNDGFFKVPIFGSEKSQWFKSQYFNRTNMTELDMLDTTCVDIITDLGYTGPGEKTSKSKNGVYVKNCGKEYYFGTKPVRAEKLWNTCATEKLLPLTITGLTEIDCIIKAYNSEAIPSNDDRQEFWVGALDLDLNRNFTFCGRKHYVVPDSIWLAGEPDNLGGREACGALVVSPAMFGGLTDLDCFAQRRVICEKPKQQIGKEVEGTYESINLEYITKPTVSTTTSTRASTTSTTTITTTTDSTTSTSTTIDSTFVTENTTNTSQGSNYTNFTLDFMFNWDIFNYTLPSSELNVTNSTQNITIFTNLTSHVNTTLVMNLTTPLTPTKTSSESHSESHSSPKESTTQKTQTLGTVQAPSTQVAHLREPLILLTPPPLVLRLHMFTAPTLKQPKLVLDRITTRHPTTSTIKLKKG